MNGRTAHPAVTAKSSSFRAAMRHVPSSFPDGLPCMIHTGSLSGDLLMNLSVDEDHHGILTEPVENNQLSVRRDVECAHGRA